MAHKLSFGSFIVLRRWIVADGLIELPRLCFTVDFHPSLHDLIVWVFEQIVMLSLLEFVLVPIWGWCYISISRTLKKLSGLPGMRGGGDFRIEPPLEEMLKEVGGLTDFLSVRAICGCEEVLRSLLASDEADFLGLSLQWDLPRESGFREWGVVAYNELRLANLPSYS
jgi:hypothetical protein